MEFECLKIAISRIKMPEDMKERIIDAVVQSCAANQNSKEIHPSVIKEPDA